MKSAFTIFVFILCFMATVQPVGADALSTGAEMVAKGIGAFMQGQAEQNLNQTFGVTFANDSDAAAMTPSQKLVYMIATANQNPLNVDWVRNGLASDIVLYYFFSVLIIVITFMLEIVQKTFPEQVSGVFQAFTGHEGFFDYSVMFTTTLKLALLPVFALPIIDFLLTIEQSISAALMKDSISYIAFTGKTAGVWFFESIAYAFTGTLFALRIQYINFFTANILKLILLMAITWNISSYIAKLLCAWFISCLIMRPIVLWYSCLAVQDIANSQQNIIAAMAATQSDMTLVILFSFLTALALVLWPVIIIVWKILCDYVLVIFYKAVRISDALGGKKR
jgi:hypothetical protein